MGEATLMRKVLEDAMHQGPGERLQTIMEMYARGVRGTSMGGGSTEKTLGTGTGWADGTEPARVEGARGVGTVEGVRGLRRAHITRHLLAGGSALLFGCRFSISPRQSSKTFAVGAERGRVSRCGRREERGAGGEKRGKEKNDAPTLMFSFALVSMCAASSSVASCWPSLACTCLDGL